MKPYVSVIMPTYNSSQFVSEAISSVLEQTFTDFELIIIDDGSTDNTLEVLERFSRLDKRVKVISQENSGGPSAPRNRGIVESSGKYLTFLDDDDLYLPSRLEKALNVLCEIEEKNCFIAINDYSIQNDVGIIPSAFRHRNFYRLLDENDSVRADKSFITNVGSLFKFSLLNYCPIHTDSITVQSDILKLNNLYFSEVLTNGEDTHLWLRMMRDRAVAVIPEVLSVYRRRRGSISDDGLRLALGSWRVQSEAHRSIRNSFCEANLRKHKKRLAGILFELAYAARYRGLLILAVTALLASIRLDIDITTRAVWRLGKTIGLGPLYLLSVRSRPMRLREQIHTSIEIMSFVHAYH